MREKAGEEIQKRHGHIGVQCRPPTQEREKARERDLELEEAWHIGREQGIDVARMSCQLQPVRMSYLG